MSSRTKILFLEDIAKPLHHILHGTPLGTDARSQYYNPNDSGHLKSALSIRDYFGSYYIGLDPATFTPTQKPLWRTESGEGIFIWGSKETPNLPYPYATRLPGALSGMAAPPAHYGARLEAVQYVGDRENFGIANALSGPTPITVKDYNIYERGAGSNGNIVVDGDILDLRLVLPELVPDDMYRALINQDRGPLATRVGQAQNSENNPSFMGTMKNGHYFDDFTFQTPAPFGSSTVLTGHRPYYNIYRPEYSFLIPEYEEAISSDSVAENILPNIYAFLAEKESNFEDIDNSIYNQLITLNGAPELCGIFVDDTVTTKTGETIRVEKDQGQYFKKYTRYLGSHPNPPLGSLVARYSRTLFSNDSMGLLKSAHDRRNLFPMYNSVEFNTSTDTRFVQTLVDLKLNDFVLSKIYQNSDAGAPSLSFAFMNQNTPLIGAPTTSAVLSTTLPYHNMSPASFSQEYVSPEEDPQEFGGVIYGPRANETFNGISQDRLHKAILGAVGTSRLRKIYESNKRSFFEILACKPAYSEVLAYEICKYRGDRLISRTAIPNSNSLDVVQYVDTQVKYNTIYTYKIKQLVVVFGARVRFQHPGSALESEALRREDYDSHGAWAVIDPARAARRRSRVTSGGYIRSIVTPNIKIFEVPYGEQTDCRVIDDPPCMPELQFIPFRGKDDRILININNAFGEYMAPPISIDPSDDEFFANVKSTQGNLQNDRNEAVVRFTGDDIAREFELYRLDYQPTSYQDFSGAEVDYSPISTTFRGSRYDSASRVDFIEKNKSYYYMARTIDYHGKLSNPTPVFEVKIVNNDGIIIPTIRESPFTARATPRKNSRKMRRYIQISPAMAHQVIPPGTTDQLNVEGLSAKAEPQLDLNEVEIGLDSEQPSAWGKAFKIRLTSRETGRKVDLNVGVNLRRRSGTD